MIRHPKNQQWYVYSCINRGNVFTKCKSAAGIGKLVFHNNRVLCNELLHTLKNNIDKNLTGDVDQLLWMVIKKPPRLVATKIAEIWNRFLKVRINDFKTSNKCNFFSGSGVNKNILFKGIKNKYSWKNKCRQYLPTAFFY